MLGKIPAYLPQKDILSYRVLSAVLFVLFISLVVFGAMTFLFPYQRYSFDFNNPDATKNNLFEPHLSDFSSVTKGKIPAQESLSLYANNPQVLESGEIILVPNDSTDITSLEGASIQVRRGWAATFFPASDEPLSFPDRNIVKYQGNFYEWKDATLYPFVSEAAAKSYLPEAKITSISRETFEGLSQTEELIGFRPGTLLAYADGVFFVTEEATIRPFGSAEVLLRAGYSFQNIIPASGEDVGIYKRGKIMLPGELHLGGTLFEDTDTRTTFLFHGKKLSPLTNEYAAFLKSKNDSVSFSGSSRQRVTSCTLSQKFLQQAYSCQFSTFALQGNGNDYQISLSPLQQEIDLQTIQVGLQSSRQQENAKLTLRSLANRVLERVGLY